MARKFFRRYMPHPERIRSDRWLRILGPVLHKPNLWHLNRQSVSRGLSFGLFWALIPMPMQMIPTALMCFRFNANLPLGIAMVWLSNPFTMPVIFYLQYRLGRMLLGQSPEAPWEFTWQSIWTHLEHLWQPLYLGALVSAVICSGLVYVLSNALWRWNTTRRHHSRHPTRLQKLHLRRARQQHAA
jgi:uncharacterized protein (DUF2062 family)